MIFQCYNNKVISLWGHISDVINIVFDLIIKEDNL